MKLLLDENLSPKLAARLHADFSGSSQVELSGLKGNPDDAVWAYARDNGFIIVSKDNDFRQKAFLLGAPPKVVWLSIGNAGTAVVETLLKRNRERIRQFYKQPEEALLVLAHHED